MSQLIAGPLPPPRALEERTGQRIDDHGDHDAAPETRDPRVVVTACGGDSEVGTGEIAAAVAGEDLALHLLGDGASAHAPGRGSDVPARSADAPARARSLVVGVRGIPGDQPRVLLTGGCAALVARLAGELGDLGFAVAPVTDRPPRDPRTGRRRDAGAVGAQSRGRATSGDLGPLGARVLLTRALRDGLFVGGAGWRQNRARPRADFWALVTALRTAVLAERDQHAQAGPQRWTRDGPPRHPQPGWRPQLTVAEGRPVTLPHDPNDDGAARRNRAPRLGV